MGVKLSEEGISIAQRVRKEKFLTYMKLAELAYVSEPTIKRFISGKPVSLTTFKEICKTLGIEEWEKLVENTQLDKTLITKDKDSYSSSNVRETNERIKGAIAITGTFSEDKQRQIRATLAMLNKLLLDGDIIITFDEDDKDN